MYCVDNYALKYTDPSGHIPWPLIAVFLAGVALNVTGSSPLPPGQAPPPEQGVFAWMLMLMPALAWYAPGAVTTGTTLACGDGDCTNEIQTGVTALCGGDCGDEISSASQAIPRIGNAGSTTEVPIDQLNSIHNVPRAGMPDNHIQNIADQISTNGYDLSRPVSATRMPNGDLVVTGGHHRIAAMQLLGETSVPVQIYDALTSNPTFVAKMLGIGRITGLYISDWMPALTPEQQQVVDSYLEAWRAANGY